MKSLSRYLIPSLWLALTVSTSAGASAQSSGPLSPGDEVRVSWRARLSSFYTPVRQTRYLEFVRMDESQLVGRYRGNLVFIDAREISSVRRRIGTKPASAPAMVIGSGAGFALGFLAGALGASASNGRSNRSASDAGLTTGVLIGAPLGALVAWVASRSHGIYESVPIRRVRPVAMISPSGRVGVSLSLGAQ